MAEPLFFFVHDSILVIDNFSAFPAMSLHDEPLIILDGATGTTLQDFDIPHSCWDGLEGCNEFLNLSAPDIIVKLHNLFLQSGSMAIETNTFGATSIVLAEYGLENRVAEINIRAVEHAKKAIASLEDSQQRYILGSVGPTTKLPVLGHIEPEELAAAIKEQVIALIEAGVDGLIIETCQDLLQVKTSLVATFELLEKTTRDIPVLCSVTFEKLGTMLVGTDIAAVCATVAPFPVFSLGLNCATGPADMISHIQYLKQNWAGRISCYPNQGMPEVVNGKTVYPMKPEEYSSFMHRFIVEEGVSIVGGCCGTSPEHIKTLCATVKGVIPARKY